MNTRNQKRIDYAIMASGKQTVHKALAVEGAPDIDSVSKDPINVDSELEPEVNLAEADTDDLEAELFRWKTALDDQSEDLKKASLREQINEHKRRHQENARRIERSIHRIPRRKPPRNNQ